MRGREREGRKDERERKEGTGVGQSRGLDGEDERMEWWRIVI